MKLKKKILTRDSKARLSTRTPAPRLLRSNPDIQSYDYYLKRLALKRGFSSYTDYLNSLARQHGFSSAKEYKEQILASRGIVTPSQQKAVLAQKLGLSSTTEYDNLLAQQRRGRPRYRKLSAMIRRLLFETGQTQNWLAKRTGVNKRLISRYVNGLSYPKKDKLDRILKVVNQHLYQHKDLADLTPE